MIIPHRFRSKILPVIAPFFLFQNISAKSPQFEASPTPHAIPGVFEAEDFSATTGTIDTVRTSRYEAGEGEAILPSNSSSVTYPVTVAKDGMYELKIRYARANGGAAVCNLSSTIGPLAVDDRRILLDKIATLDYSDSRSRADSGRSGSDFPVFYFLGKYHIQPFCFSQASSSYNTSGIV